MQRTGSLKGSCDRQDMEFRQSCTSLSTWLPRATKLSPNFFQLSTTLERMSFLSPVPSIDSLSPKNSSHQSDFSDSKLKPGVTAVVELDSSAGGHGDTVRGQVCLSQLRHKNSQIV